LKNLICFSALPILFAKLYETTPRINKDVLAQQNENAHLLASLIIPDYRPLSQTSFTKYECIVVMPRIAAKLVFIPHQLSYVDEPVLSMFVSPATAAIGAGEVRHNNDNE